MAYDFPDLLRSIHLHAENLHKHQVSPHPDTSPSKIQRNSSNHGQGNSNNGKSWLLIRKEKDGGQKAMGKCIQSVE